MFNFCNPLKFQPNYELVGGQKIWQVKTVYRRWAELGCITAAEEQHVFYTFLQFHAVLQVFGDNKLLLCSIRNIIFVRHHAVLTIKEGNIERNYFELWKSELKIKHKRYNLSSLFIFIKQYCSLTFLLFLQCKFFYSINFFSKINILNMVRSLMDSWTFTRLGSR